MNENVHCSYWVMLSGKFKNNLKLFLAGEDMSMREFSRVSGISPATLTRIYKLKENDEIKIHPKTLRAFETVIGHSLDELTKFNLADLKEDNKQLKQYKIKFIDIKMQLTSESIMMNEPYSYALKINTNSYAPLIQKDTILFFSKDQGKYQKDICLYQASHNSFDLGIIIEIYRDISLVQNLQNMQIKKTNTDRIKAIVQKQLNP